MGVYWYPANYSDKEYFDPSKLGDNLKFPIDQTAVALFELLGPDGRWFHKRVGFVSDSGDLPWQVDQTWKDITKHAAGLLDEHTTWWSDEPIDGVYRMTRVFDELRLSREQGDRSAEFLPAPLGRTNG